MKFALQLFLGWLIALYMERGLTMRQKVMLDALRRKRMIDMLECPNTPITWNNLVSDRNRAIRLAAQ